MKLFFREKKIKLILYLRIYESVGEIVNRSNQRQSNRATEIVTQQSSNEVIDRTLNNKQLINQLLIKQRVHVFPRIADSHTYRNRKINRI